MREVSTLARSTFTSILASRSNWSGLAHSLFDTHLSSGNVRMPMRTYSKYGNHRSAMTCNTATPPSVCERNVWILPLQGELLLDKLTSTYRSS